MVEPLLQPGIAENFSNKNYKYLNSYRWQGRDDQIAFAEELCSIESKRDLEELMAGQDLDGDEK